MKTRKTRKGWVIEITNTVHGCLEQGGVCGREIFYSLETLSKHGIDYNMDPDSDDISDGNSNAAWLHHCVTPDKVIRVGRTIQ